MRNDVAKPKAGQSELHQAGLHTVQAHRSKCFGGQPDSHQQPGV
jgi:hypothetical protein